MDWRLRIKHSHMSMPLEGMFDLKECKIPVRFGNKREVYATKVGKLRGNDISKRWKGALVIEFGEDYHQWLCCKVWAKCATHVTNMENVIVQKARKAGEFEKFYGKTPLFTSNI